MLTTLLHARPARAQDVEAEFARGDHVLDEHEVERPGIVRVGFGIGGQPVAGEVGAIVHVDAGGRPMLGGLIVTVSSTLYVNPSALVWTTGFAAELDITHVIETAFYTRREVDAERLVQISLGGRIGLSYGRDAQPIPFDLGERVYEVLRPEWSFYAEGRIRVAPGWYVTARPMIDVPIDFGDVARWSVTVGGAYAWR
ncbi:hypothetical protein [Sandaracinus amylolyticus]|uniref:Uncharacterized protein n=1 Tax=Sandaracinus amylolyticus TaxID=927083 RepID=A0A0F6W8P1_9BACT|nr:hypothetical protein [Sandaracinus amylolyticus]AKF10158.1 hypothetical protein DB32_007307 [Sandaracinus amylolyticus]